MTEREQVEQAARRTAQAVLSMRPRAGWMDSDIFEAAIQEITDFALAQRQAVAREIADECDKLKHPHHDEWNWSEPTHKREPFYKSAQTGAWRQAGHEMARRIRSRYLTRYLLLLIALGVVGCGESESDPQGLVSSEWHAPSGKLAEIEPLPDQIDTAGIEDTEMRLYTVDSSDVSFSATPPGWGVLLYCTWEPGGDRWPPPDTRPIEVTCCKEEGEECHTWRWEE